MRWKPVGLSAMTMLLVVAANSTQGAGVRDSVVRVTSNARFPHPTKPWTKREAVANAGSGVVIDGNRILTCAHVVAYATRIQVRGEDDTEAVNARLKAVDFGHDLALLEVEEPAFFEKHKPLRRGKGYPSQELAVEAYGYPEGGQNLAVTRGIISRIEASDPSEGIWIQVDAAINPGSSGGPIVFFGQLLGLIRARGNPDQAENVGMVVALPQIEAFLLDAEDGVIDERPRVGFHTQAIDNPAARERLGIGKEIKGVMISCLDVNGPHDFLKPDDVLTKVGDYDLDNEGMVRLDRGFRAPFESVFTMQPGSVKSLGVEIIRDKAKQKVEVPLTRGGRLFPSFDGQKARSYLVYGPLVFSKAYSDLRQFALRARADLMGMHTPLSSRLLDSAALGEELVIITSPLLPHEINRGYVPEDAFGRVVEEIDGVRIKNFAHLVETLRDGTSPYVCIRTAEHPPLQLVYRRDQIREATDRVLEENDIPKPMSADIEEIWNAKAK